MSFSDEYYDEEAEEQAQEQADEEAEEELEDERADGIGPLSGKSNIAHHVKDTMTSHSIQIGKPSYAKSFASSAIGHPTYFDQMETNKPQTTKQSKCNRIYSYFNLLDFILQLAVFAILSSEYYGNYAKCTSKYAITNDDNDNCTGKLLDCEQDTECMYEASICECIPSFDSYSLLFFIYMMLTALILLYALCRSCLICFSLRNRSNNQNLFHSGHVMHQSWMNRIADDCWIALCCGCSCKSCCCNNMARIAYLAAIDQYKAFPTKAVFIVNTIIKILNIAFCGTQLYLRRSRSTTLFVISVSAVGVLFIVTFIITICRMRTKRNAKAMKDALAMHSRQGSHR